MLLSGKYINNHQKLEYICNNGHKHSVCWNKFQYGVRCPYCSKYSRKYTIDIIRKSFEDEGYILLTIDYIKAKQKLDYICPNGHIHKVSWYEWRYFGSRCPICFFINNSGSGNPNWKGGISCEPYCDIWLDKDFKESIKERDDHRCQNPDCWGTSKRLSVHHIDYDKKNCRPENLITLCNSCNSRANKDRERHKDFYRTIIKKKYILRRFKNGSGNSLDKI